MSLLVISLAQEFIFFCSSVKETAVALYGEVDTEFCIRSLRLKSQVSHFLGMCIWTSY